MSKNLWTREELIVTLSLYFKLPFGRLNRNTKEVIELANIIGRTNNSVALRLVNFAACDPYIINSGRTGMPAGVKVCQPIWDEFYNNKEMLFLTAQQLLAEYQHTTVEHTLNLTQKDFTGKTKETVVKQRVNQNVFRTMILNNYNYNCAITGINIPELLIASHIIPWADDESQRLNPENGICLSALYDRAFDKGLITISPDNYRVNLSPELLSHQVEPYFEKHFKSIDGISIRMPEEHTPNRDFLAYHRDNIFIKD